MSYKVKSLLYFSCFLASSLLYYNMDKESQKEVNTLSTEIEKEEVEPMVFEELAYLEGLQ